MNQIPETVDEIAVRAELINACALAGSQAAFAQTHNINQSVLCAIIHGRKSPGIKIAGLLGFSKVTRYVKRSPARSEAA